MDLSRFTTHAVVPSEFRDLYALEGEKLEALYSKSKRHQWNAELDVDWDDFDPTADILDRDTEFLFRAIFATPVRNVARFSYFKREHQDALTAGAETGLNSPMRSELLQAIKQRAEQNRTREAGAEAPILEPISRAAALPLSHVTGPKLRTQGDSSDFQGN